MFQNLLFVHPFKTNANSPKTNTLPSAENYCQLHIILLCRIFLITYELPVNGTITPNYRSKSQKMITRNLNKMQSYQRIADVLNDNQSVFETDESTKSQITIFTGYHTVLKNKQANMNKPTKWLTSEKNALLISLDENSQIIIVAMIRFANDTNNQEALNELDDIKLKLGRSSQVNRLQAASQLHLLAHENASELADYSISVEFITSYLQIINDIDDKLTERIRILDQNKQVKGEFEDQIKITDIFLNDKLDWSIESYRPSHPDMVNAYLIARKLSKTIYQHIAVRGFIVDKETGENIPYGEVSVVENEMSTKITEKGNFSFKNFPEGEFTLKIENINYETSILTIRRYNNQYLNIKVELQALPIPHPAY